MGMTDKQFDSYKLQLLRRLQVAKREGKQLEVIDELIEDFENELRKP